MQPIGENQISLLHHFVAVLINRRVDSRINE